MHGDRLSVVFRVLYRTHDDIVIKLGGDIFSRPQNDQVFVLFDYDNAVVQTITLILENSYKTFVIYVFSYRPLADKSNIMCKIHLAKVDDSITHTFRYLRELRDHVNTCELVSLNIIHVLLAEVGIIISR